MGVITLNIPDSANIDDKEATTFMAAMLYEKGKLSLGQAADLAGFSKTTFAELLSNYGVSIFNYSATDISNDVANA